MMLGTKYAREVIKWLNGFHGELGNKTPIQMTFLVNKEEGGKVTWDMHVELSDEKGKDDLLIAS
jgi:hypothetical protein